MLDSVIVMMCSATLSIFLLLSVLGEECDSAGCLVVVPLSC